jgi:hypothetical protein
MALGSFFSVSQYTSDVSVVPLCINSSISIPFLSQETDAISFLADICVNIFGLFVHIGACFPDAVTVEATETSKDTQQ